MSFIFFKINKKYCYKGKFWKCIKNGNYLVTINVCVIADVHVLHFWKLEFVLNFLYKLYFSKRHYIIFISMHYMNKAGFFMKNSYT